MKLKRAFAMILLVAMAFSQNLQVVLAANSGTNYAWDSVPYGGGGYVTGLVFHPLEEGLVYIRTDVGGAYRWDSANGKWIPLCDMFSINDSNLYGIDGIAVDPNDSNTVYICAGKYPANLADSYGTHNQRSKYPACDVLKSTDKGSTWQSTGLNVNFNGNGNARNFGECIAVDPVNSNNIYVFSRSNELWYSSDAAESWEKLSNFPTFESGNARIIEIDAASAQNGSSKRIFAGVYGQGVYVSTDMGQSWTNITGANGPTSPTSMKLTNDGTKLYVTASNGVYLYNGSTWSDITPSTSVQYNGIDIDKTNNNIIYVSRTQGDNGKLFNGHIFRTQNGGTTWQDLYSTSERNSTVSWWPERYFFANTSAVKINPFNSSEIWVSDWYGVWRTDNIDRTPNAIWTNDIDGLENMVAFSAVSLPEETKLIGGVADNAGAAWDNINGYPSVSMLTSSSITDVTDLDFCEGAPNIVVRAGSDTYGKYGYSTDYGKTWTHFANFPKDGSGNNLLSGKVSVSADVDSITGEPTIFVMPIGSGGYYSKDMGKTWNECSGEPEGLINSRFTKVNCISSDRVTPDVFYVYSGGKFYVSSDGGATFEQKISNLPVYGQAQVKAAPYMAGEVWVALGADGLYTSNNYGVSLKKIANVTRANFIAFGKPADGRTNPTAFLYGEVSGRTGLFISVDMGERWARIDDDNRMIGCEPMCLAGDRQEFGVVYVGTNGRGFTYGKPSAQFIKAVNEPTQTVLRTIVSDTKNNFCEQHLTNYGSQSAGMNSDMSYNGNSSFAYKDCKSVMRYRQWETVNIADGNSDIATAVDAGTAYICGWFYFERGDGNTNNATVQMISEGAAKSSYETIKPGKWTFVSAPIYDLKNKATCGVIDTLGTGTLYVDDLCVISTSDGAAPIPTARTYTVAGASFDDGPNRYGKVVRTIFDGVTGTKTVGPNGTYTQVTDTVKEGYNYSWQFSSYANNLWLLSGAKAISTDATLSSYVEKGNLYWTAWMCMSDKSGGVSVGGYQPGGNSKWKANEWFWVCIKISNTSEKAKWLDTKSNTVWLTDIKLMTFEREMEDSERPQNVIQTVFNGSDNSSYIGPGGTGVSIDTSFVMKGSTRSIKLDGSGHQLWYLSGAKKISENATLKSYAEKGNLYWTAWAYISNSSNSLSIPGGKKKIGTWFYICKPITDTSATHEWINESGAIIWLTDIKLMAYDEVEPEEEELVLATVFDGSDDSSYVGPNGSNVSVDKEFVMDGSYRSLKLAGSGHNLWYLSGAKAISTNATLKSYAEEGNLYWTAWAYIEKSNSSLSIPGGTKKIGEWFRICKPITDTSATSEWIKESNTNNTNTIWLTDIKLIAMVEKQEEENEEPEHILKGLQIDAFEITGINSPTKISAGETANAKVEIFNDSLSNEDVILMVSEYSEDNQLIGCVLDRVKANTFRSRKLNVSYDVSENSGNKIKMFLWNDGNMMPLCQYRDFDVE